MGMKIINLFLLLCCFLGACAHADQKAYKISSPEKAVAVRFQLGELGQPFYQVFYKDSLVLDTSWMGFDVNKMNMWDPLSGFKVRWLLM